MLLRKSEAQENPERLAKEKLFVLLEKVNEAIVLQFRGDGDRVEVSLGVALTPEEEFAFEIRLLELGSDWETRIECDQNGQTWIALA